MSEVLAWAALVLMFCIILLTCLLPSIWKRRRVFVEAMYALLVVSILFAATSGAGFFLHAIGIVYGFTCIAGFFLAIRLHIGRLPEQFLRRNSLSTAAVTMLAAACVLSLSFFSIGMLAVGAMLVALLMAFGLILQTAWALTHYIFDIKKRHVSRAHLPTVTLAIPARNETLALAVCLDAALQSDYQKMEVLVLDDCSYDNTSGLIRSYAHAGVRFIQGEAPSSGWLGKSNAYSQLAKEASGDIILFIGVDTQLQPESVSRLIAYILAHKLDMVSVLPKLDAPFGAASLLQNLRYVWQIILPLRRRRVPVSSEA